MNATEQRTHRTVTQEQALRIADLEVIVDTLSTNQATLYAMCETLHGMCSSLKVAVTDLEAKQNEVRVPSGLIL